MGDAGKRLEKASRADEPKLPPSTPVPSQQERRLVLKFIGKGAPRLQRAEFYPSLQEQPFVRQLGEDYFKWDRPAQSLSLALLDYVYHSSRKPAWEFEFVGAHRGSLAASLGDAISKESGVVSQLFRERLPGTDSACVGKVFHGPNLGGGEQKPRMIRVHSRFLPPGWIEISWDGEELTEPKLIKKLANQIRTSLQLDVPEEQPIPADEPPTHAPEPDANKAAQVESLDTARRSQAAEHEHRQTAEVDSLSPNDQFRFGKWLANEVGEAIGILKGKRKSGASRSKDSNRRKPKDASHENVSEPDEGKASPRKQIDPQSVNYAPTPIDPRLFVVPPTTGYWPDNAPLVELPGDENNQVWTLKNAFEGVLILGRTGSGKTSGSGFTFAESFLRAGFGGLVLTVKKNEAERWRALCAYCGRENDLIIVRRGGDWKLNALAYEAQHPGQGSGLSENLTVFCRNLLRISTRSRAEVNHDPVWQNAGDELLNATFDLFLLAGCGITFDRLAEFVSAAPTADIPKTENAWLSIPAFGEVFAKAKSSLLSAEDKRLYNKATNYWFKIYPGYSSKTRTSVTIGIFAMLDAFRGRDIPALISSDTNVTPESIMAGKIVVIDLPLKELHHTGLMVQSAWKYLFQLALERQNRDNNPRCRPVFLWEDEGQYFFSDHDHRFQDTARSARISRVILTQNLHSFYKEFGGEGETITNSVFGNLNTKVFHNNSDPQTNRWSADHFGQAIQTRYSITNSPAPQPGDFFGMIRQNLIPPNTTSVSAGEHWEPAVRPEEFNSLRTGGPENDFMVDAYITWMGLSAERQRHFTKITFEQNQKL